MDLFFVYYKYYDLKNLKRSQLQTNYIVRRIYNDIVVSSPIVLYKWIIHFYSFIFFLWD